MIELTIDGTVVSVPQGTTIFDAARLNGIAIPTLCHQQNENPVGVCRVCVVDLGQRVYAASCIRQAEPGMKVSTGTAPVQNVRHTLLELLMADHPAPCARQQHSGDCELETSGCGCGTSAVRGFRGAARRADTTIPPSPSPSITRPAFSATAASAAATTSATTGSWRGAARDIRPASPSTTTCRWATRPASPAANAWCRAHRRADQ